MNSEKESKNMDKEFGFKVGDKVAVTSGNEWVDKGSYGVVTGVDEEDELDILVDFEGHRGKLKPTKLWVNSAYLELMEEEEMSKFKVGDKVKVIGGAYSVTATGSYGEVISKVDVDNNVKVCFEHIVDEPSRENEAYWIDVNYLQLMTDNINSPAHYTQGSIQPLEYIEANELNFHEANVIKYITRARRKGKHLEDLNKAKFYIEREIQNLEQGGCK